MRRIIFNYDRKKLYIILSSIFIFILSLTIVYAALGVTLNIVGNGEVAAANWNIYFDNIELNSGSATTDLPVISGNKVSFSTVLNKPGDFYEFTVDVVNGGSIDAIIDRIEKKD